MANSRPASMPVTKSQVVIGIRGDIATGSDFYNKIEIYMAELWKNENVRPSFYLDLGPKAFDSNFLKQRHIDFVIDVTKSDSLAADPAMHIANTIFKSSHTAFDTKALPPTDALKGFNVNIHSVAAMPTKSSVEQPAITLNVLGGMGPIAGADYVSRLGKSLTEMKTEDVKLRGYSNPIHFNGSSAAAGFLTGGNRGPFTYKRNLQNFIQKVNADPHSLLAAPSNTFNSGVKKAANLISGLEDNLINMINAVTQKTLLAVDDKSTAKIGLLATTKCVNSKAYEKSFAEQDAKIFCPSAALQKIVQSGIDSVKAGDIAAAKEKFAVVIDDFKQQGIDKIILGCTEIPLGVDQSKWSSLQFLDTTQMLADAMIEHADSMLMSLGLKPAESTLSSEEMDLLTSFETPVQVIEANFTSNIQYEPQLVTFHHDENVHEASEEVLPNSTQLRL